MKIEMAGKRFGRLTVLKDSGRDKRKQVLWKCLCDCGKIIVCLGNNLRSGHTKSCGCLGQEVSRKMLTTHGLSNTLSYKTWEGMVQRCINPNNVHYKDYGGRGVKVCGEWLKFEAFYKDMGERPKGLTIERKNNDLGYFKDNCYWASMTAQNRNKRINRNNTTGENGISWIKETKKYRAEITVNYKKIHLGCFTKIEDAVVARQKAEQECW